MIYHGKSIIFSIHIQRSNFFFIIVTPHHQMRHKSQIQKLGFRHNVIEENTSFEMVKKLCFYHNQKLNYNLRNALYCGVANMRKMGLKLALFII